MSEARRKMAARFTEQVGLDEDLPLDPDLDPAFGDRRDRQQPPDRAGSPTRDPRRPRRSWPRPQPRMVLAVAIGGFLGGAARDVISNAFPAGSGRFPAALFAINTTGAFLLALLLVLFAEVLRPATYLRPLLGTGFMGAFTTFSSVVVAVDQLLVHGHLEVGVAFFAASLIAALAAASVGLVLGRAAGANQQQRAARWGDDHPHPAEPDRPEAGP